MVEVYRVGVNLKLVDEATPALRRLMGTLAEASEAAEKLKAVLTDLAGTRLTGLSRSVAGIEQRLGAVSNAAKAMTDTIGAAFDRLGVGLGALRTELGEVAAELRGIVVASRGIREPLAGGPIAGRGGGGRGRHGDVRLHAGSEFGPLRGYFSPELGEAAGLVGGFGAYEAIKNAATEQQAIFFTLLAAGVRPDSPAGRQFAEQIRQAAETASRGTIYSRLAVEKLIPAIAGVTDLPLQQTIPFFGPALRFGELIAQFGKQQGVNFDPTESTIAAIRTGHLLGLTQPQQLEPILNALSVASTTTRESPATLTRQLAYQVAASRAAGLTNQQVLDLSALTAIYIPGTRAGTSVNRLFEALNAGAGPLPSGRGRRAQLERRGALISAGLLDPSGHLIRDQSGDVLLPLLQNLQRYQQGRNAQDVQAFFQQVFGEQGARAASALSQDKVIQQLQELYRRQQVFSAQGGVAGLQGLQQQNLLPQAQRAWANLQTILTDLGSATVPGLTAAFKGLNTVLEGVRGLLEQHQTAAAGIGYGGLAAGAYAGYRLFRRFAGFATGGRAVPAAEAAAGAAGEAATGGAGSLVAGGAIATAAGGLRRIIPAAAGAGVAYDVYSILSDLFTPHAEENVKRVRENAPEWLAWTKYLPDPSAAAGSLLNAGSTAFDWLRQHLFPTAHAEEMQARMQGTNRGVRPPGAGGGAGLERNDVPALAASIEKGLAAGFASLAAKPVNLNGQVTLNGNVNLSIPEFSNIVGRVVAQGVQRAMGSLSGAPASPDLRRALVSPH